MNGNIFDEGDDGDGENNELLDDIAGVRSFVRIQDILEVLDEPMESVQNTSRLAVKRLFLDERYVVSSGAGMIRRHRFDVFINILTVIPELLAKGVSVGDLKRIQEKLKEVKDCGAS